ncbi:MAG: glycosyltransferase family 2 protein [Archaeoglobus sp.]|nr:MAG: glycosyltransferase family 2 protein [Archaeoglobus sp.]
MEENSKNEKPDVSIVLPAYNEARNIERAVKAVIETLRKTGFKYEIIIAEDGSTDGTDRIAAGLADGKKILHLHSDERLGRGGALNRAFLSARGDVVAFLDVDLSTDITYLPELIDKALKHGIAIGSRLKKNSITSRPIKRDIPSKVYNFLVRLLLGSKLSDHQCGFKAFRRDIILNIIPKVKDKHWFWDTEVLVVAQRMGYDIVEIPVRWKQGKETKVSVARDSLYMFKCLLKMWLGRL